MRGGLVKGGFELRARIINGIVILKFKLNFSRTEITDIWEITILTNWLKILRLRKSYIGYLIYNLLSSEECL